MHAARIRLGAALRTIKKATTERADGMQTATLIFIKKFTRAIRLSLRHKGRNLQGLAVAHYHRRPLTRRQILESKLLPIVITKLRRNGGASLPGSDSRACAGNSSRILRKHTPSARDQKLFADS